MSGATLGTARRALLGLMGGTSDGLTELTPNDWDAVSALARMHRLGPILHHQTRGEATIPATLATAWQAAFRKAAMRSLQFQKMLLAAATVLNKRGTPWLALKGAWLAWHVYPHPALRPMRDIDILVEPDHVIAAYDALLSSGFERMVAHATPLDVALASHKHLPPLRHTATGLSIELHHRMVYDPVPGAPFSDVAALIRDGICRPLAGKSIPLPDPTASLLHLIIHSAHDHDLDNGPLILTDLAEAANEEIDWPRFWQMAEQGGWMQGSRLLIALTRQQLPSAAERIPAPPGPPVPASVLDAAAEMLLPDMRTALSQSLGVELDEHGSGLRNLLALLRRALPQRHVVAATARVPDHSALVWRYYPLWLWRKASTLLNIDRAQVNIDVAHRRELRHWLHDHGR